MFSDFRVDLAVITINEYSNLSQAPELENHRQM